MISMRYRNRAAFRDLLLKQRNNASVAAKHVAEPHGHKFRIVMFVKNLNNHLADTLARPHNVRRIYRLIR